MRLATALNELTEKEFTTLVVGTRTKPGLARGLNFRCYHTLRSKGSEPGFPDWTLVRERVVFLELKTAKGTVSDAQSAWLTDIHRAGEAYVVRPKHLEAIKHVLQARGTFDRWTADQLEARGELLLELDQHITTKEAA